MMLLTFWTVKAEAEVRGFDFGDVNKDGVNEVVFATWDGRIYFVNAQSGQVIKKFPKKHYLEGVAENVLVLNGSGEGRSIVASYNRKVIGLEFEEDKPVWESRMDSWILKLVRADIDEDGEDEVVGLTTSGTKFGLEWGGRKLWVVEGSKALTPNKMVVGDINFDGAIEIISVGRDSRLLEIMGSDGGVIHNFKLHDEIESISIGDIRPGLEGVLIVGTKSSIYFWSEDFKKMYKIKDGHVPYYITVTDVNHDGVNEILVCDWLRNRVNILSIDEDQKVRKFGDISVEGNPVYANMINLQNGDGTEKIAIATKSTEIGVEDIFQIGQGRKKIELVWSASIHPPVVGDILGFGSQELLIRTNREELSLIMGIPKIAVPEIITEGTDFTVATWTPADFVFESSRTLKLIERTSSTRKKFNEVGFITTNTYKLKARKAGKARLRLSQRSGRRGLIKSIYIFSNSRTITDSTPLIVSKEDKIILDTSLDIEEIDVLTKKVSAKLVKEGGNQHLFISTYLDGLITVPLQLTFGGKDKGKKSKTLPLKMYFTDPLQVELSSKEVMLEGEEVEVKVSNKSNRSLVVSLEIEEPIDSSPISIKVASKKSRKASIKIDYTPKEIIEQVETVILVTYRGLKTHKLTVPLKTKIVNKSMLKEIIKEIKSTVKTKKKFVESLKEVLKLSEDQIEELIKKI